VQGGKTKAARRRVPLHRVLVEAGVQDKAEELHAMTASVVSKRFTRWRRQRRVKDDGKVFHSLRHTFAKRLEDAGVEPSRIARILGHSAGFSLDTYSAGLELASLKAAVDSVSDQGLSL
jgi:integrase